eukprot:GHVN01014306.1.p1 GENE.GHVN01014306.1~~GHVN01014306.1.p1  ORF type:complete len:222 (+),score=9.45 GHVN01014306.1:249-914(+)
MEEESRSEREAFLNRAGNYISSVCVYIVFSFLLYSGGWALANLLWAGASERSQRIASYTLFYFGGLFTLLVCFLPKRWNVLKGLLWAMGSFFYGLVQGFIRMAGGEERLGQFYFFTLSCLFILAIGFWIIGMSVRSVIKLVIAVAVLCVVLIVVLCLYSFFFNKDSEEKWLVFARSGAWIDMLFAFFLVGMRVVYGLYKEGEDIFFHSFVVVVPVYSFFLQ